MVQEVVVNSNTCENLIIRASNKETGLEGTRLTPNGVLAGKRIFKPHILTVQTTEGQSLPNAQYLWAFPAAYVAPGLGSFTSPSVETALIGKYTVTVSIGNSTCPLSVDLGAEQCTPIPDDYICGTSPSIITPSTTGGILIDLARDDVFTAADYNVKVTEISSGNAQSGFMGRGYIDFNFVNPTSGSSDPVALGIEVTLENVKINDCYQLIGGQVKTVFDPTWTGIVSADQLIKFLADTYAEIKILLDDVTANTIELQKKLKELRAEKVTLNNSGLNPTYITEQTTAIDLVINDMVCLVGEPGAKVNALLLCNAQSVFTNIGQAETILKNSQICPFLGDIFDEEGNYLTTLIGGIYPRIIIKLNSGKFVIVRNWPILTKLKAKFFSKILTRYFDQLGLIKSNIYNGEISVQLGGWEAYNFHPNTYAASPLGKLMWSYTSYNMIVAYVYHEDGTISDFLTYTQNVKSAIFHEYLHSNGYDSKGDKSIEEIEIHLKVYSKQVQNKEWALCTPAFKKEMLKNISDYINKFNTKDYFSPQKFQYWKNHFKQLGFYV
jgi:Metallopeptidase toxin 2